MRSPSFILLPLFVGSLYCVVAGRAARLIPYLDLEPWGSETEAEAKTLGTTCNLGLRIKRIRPAKRACRRSFRQMGSKPPRYVHGHSVKRSSPSSIADLLGLHYQLNNGVWIAATQCACAFGVGLDSNPTAPRATFAGVFPGSRSRRPSIRFHPIEMG